MTKRAVFLEVLNGPILMGPVYAGFTAVLSDGKEI
jgi:hypothetical protein